MRRYLFSPAMWSLGRKLVRRDIFKEESRKPPDHSTAFSEILVPRGDDEVWVPVDKTANQAGQSFSAEQHHFVQYLQSGLGALESFYRNHRPTNALEAVFIYETFQYQPLSKVFSFPWSHAVRPVRNPVFFGPVSSSELAFEARRLDKLNQSFMKKGFLEKV